jgi:predicted RND superfamily exporter protein
MPNLLIIPTRNPVLVVVVSFLIVFCFSTGLQYIKLTGDYREFFDKDNSHLESLESVQKTFTKNDNIAILVYSENGTVYDKDALNAIWSLTEKSWEIPYSRRVDSIANYQHSYASNDEVIIDHLIPDSLNIPDSDEVKRITENEPSLIDRLVSRDGKLAVVNVTVILPEENQTTAVSEVTDYVRSMIEKQKIKAPELSFRLIGVVALNDSFSRISQEDGATIIPAMFLLVLFLASLLLRSFGSLFSIFLVMLLSILGAMGLGGYLGMPVTNVSIQAPTIIMTIAIADCIHVLVTFRDRLRQGMNKLEAINDSLVLNYKPIILTSITTIISFLALNFSEAPPFRDLGNLVAMGVAIAMVLSLTLLPAFLYVLPIKVSVKEKEDSLFSWFGNFLCDKRKTILPILILIIASLGIQFPNNELNDEVVKYFGEQTEFRQSVEMAERHLAGGLDISIVIDSKQQRGINDPEFLKALSEITDWLRQQPEAGHVTSLSDTIKRLNKNMNNDEEGYYRLPESKELAAQYIMLYELSLPYRLDLNNIINQDKSKTRLIVNVENIGSKEQVAFEKRIREFIQNYPVIKQTDIAGTGLIFAHISEKNMTSMVYGTLLVLALVSFMIGLFMRSVKLGLVSIISNLIPIIVGFGLWALLYGQINLAISIVSAATLGIVVDDTIHFLSKFKYALCQKMSPRDAVIYTMENVGRAITFTTVALIAGFSLLMLSSLAINGLFGLSIIIVIAAAWVVDLFILPILLLMIYSDYQVQDAVVMHDEKAV